MALNEYKQALSEAKNFESLEKVLAHHLKSLGFSTYSFTYHAYHPKSKQKLKYDCSSKNLKRWHDHYLAENYHEVDSTLDEIYQTTMPACWTLKQQLEQAKSQREKQMRLDSIEFGATEGISIPIHGPHNDFAILMVELLKSDKKKINWEFVKDELLLVALYYYHAVREMLVVSQSANVEVSLSKREMQCLQFLAEQRSVAEIASKLKITKRTVNFHFQNINHKLGVKNKYQALSKALEERFLIL